MIRKHRRAWVACFLCWQSQANYYFLAISVSVYAWMGWMNENEDTMSTLYIQYTSTQIAHCTCRHVCVRVCACAYWLLYFMNDVDSNVVGSVPSLLARVPRSHCVVRINRLWNENPTCQLHQLQCTCTLRIGHEHRVGEGMFSNLKKCRVQWPNII